MEVDDNISPTSKINTLKIDIFLCNGLPISQSTEFSAEDLEKIWTQGLRRNLDEIIGYTSGRTKGNKEFRLQYQLKKPMSIREVATEQEFNHERSSIFATEIFQCRVVGLGSIRRAEIGETVRVTVSKPNFDITPEQVVEWMSRYGKIAEGHR